VSSHRPRERLAAQGGEALSDAEILALLIRTGARDADALVVAERLLVAHGGLRGIARAALSELRDAPGVGPVKSAALAAAAEFGRRVTSRTLRIGTEVRSPADVHRHFHARLRDAPVERFLCLLLDGRHRVVREVQVSQGTLTASLVHPREVFREAIRESAAALILVHNHPSGDPTPSREDLEVTDRLARAGDLLGVRVLDHVVVAETGYRSLREEGHLGEPGAGFEEGSASGPEPAGR
jgi:DNA repair protein RadC